MKKSFCLFIAAMLVIALSSYNAATAQTPDTLWTRSFLLDNGQMMRSLIFTQDSKNLYVGCWGTNKIYYLNAQTGAILKEILNVNVYAMKLFNNDNYLASTNGLDNNLFIWDTRTWQEINNYKLPNKDGTAGFDVSNDNKIIALGTYSSGLLKYDIQNNRIVDSLKFTVYDETLHTNVAPTIGNVSYSTDNKYLTINTSTGHVKGVYIVDPSAWTIKEQITGFDNINKVQFIPNSYNLLILCPNDIYIYDFLNKQILKHINNSSIKNNFDVGFSSDLNYLI